MSEAQKPVTDKYKKGYERIFEKKKPEKKDTKEEQSLNDFYVNEMGL